MQKNLYFRTVVRRQNPFSLVIFKLFYGMSSYARLLLEVFIRKNFGERYFNLPSAIMAFLIFMFIPYLTYLVSTFGRDHRGNSVDFLQEYASWYAFLVAFLVMSVRRWREIRRVANIYDFTLYSLYRGDISDFFFDLPVFKKKPDVRTVEILIEPAFFLMIGILLWLIGQGAGLILIICSLLYSLGYASDYQAGDDYVLDIIDQIHLNQEMKKSFFEEDADPNNPRHNNFRGRRPQNHRDWQTVVDATIVEDDIDSKEAL